MILVREGVGICVRIAAQENKKGYLDGGKAGQKGEGGGRDDCDDEEMDGGEHTENEEDCQRREGSQGRGWGRRERGGERVLRRHVRRRDEDGCDEKSVVERKEKLTRDGGGDKEAGGYADGGRRRFALQIEWDGRKCQVVDQTMDRGLGIFGMMRGAQSAAIVIQSPAVLIYFSCVPYF